MEAVEDTNLEAAIGWLSDTILANLPAGGKLDSWIRQAGLGNDIGMLKSEVEAVEMVVSAVQGRAAGNKPLAKSLARVKELLYDADDVVDELDCYRLQQELQPETLLETDGHGMQQTVERCRENADDVHSSSNGRLRSKEWIHFEITEFEQNGGPARARCKHCEKVVMCTTKMGTSVLRNHLNSKGCSQKRGANEHLRIEDITRQLQVQREAVTKLLKILGASSNHCHITISDARRRTSGLLQGKVYGRAAEKRSIKKSIEEHKSTVGVTVLPIVGIGGVGKTAVAQLVYNDPALESQFDYKIWIWVSDNFDEMRLTREMLDCVSQETHYGICSFPKLQEALKCCIKSKRVLIILDDVWEDMDDGRWNKLLAPFKSGGANGNMIIITTRKPSIAKRRGTITPIKLGALRKDDFWLLFKASAFGDENYEEQASLTDLGQKIAQKLIGNPLAAQTAGALLIDHLAVDHWSSILMTEDWKSLQHTAGIMSSLKLSYDELPYRVQQCFSYCSIFPYDYQFIADELVRIWISQGFVKRDHSIKSLEEMGQYYLTDLVNLGLFEQVERKRSSLGSQTQTCYAMCALMYDFARLVSRTECAILEDLQCNEILPNVHHLSILTSFVYQRVDQTRNIPRSEKFELLLQNIVASVRKLRTLVLIGEYDSFFFKAFQDVFGKVDNLRLLQMSAKSADFNSFLCSLVNPTRLRYLKLQDDHTEQKALPHVLSKFFHLQVLEVDFLMSAISLLHTVHLEDCGGWSILPSLEMLPFIKRLKLSNMERVREVLIPSLEEFVLDGMPYLQRCSCTSVGGMKSSLRVLEIESCPALKVFDLFQNGHNYETEHKLWLPGLRKLIIRGCPLLQVQVPLPPSAIFYELLIKGVSTFMAMEGSSMGKFQISGDTFLHDTLDDKILAFHNLKDIKYLEISSCKSVTSIPFKGLSQLISLRSLKIVDCRELFSSDDVPEQTHEDMITANYTALPSLESLSIGGCGITGKWLSLIMRHSPTLKGLYLRECPQLKQLKVEEEGAVQSDFLSILLASSSRYLYDASRSSVQASSAYAVVHISLNLKRISIHDCPHLIFYGSREGALENGRYLLPQSLEQLVWSNYSRKTLRPCFVANVTCLKKLCVRSGSLESLQLDSCTALEDLEINKCKQLVALESMQSLGTLRSLVLIGNSRLESLQLHSCMLLEHLEIRVCWSLVTLEGLRSLVHLKRLKIQGRLALDALTTVESRELIVGISSHSFELFPELESLELISLDARRLTHEQESALLLLRSLQELQFRESRHLEDLPSGLCSLPSLKRLEIQHCNSISGLPKEGLPPSLEELVINSCSDKLSEACRSLATSKLEVKIDWRYVD